MLSVLHRDDIVVVLLWLDHFVLNWLDMCLVVVLMNLTVMGNCDILVPGLLYTLVCGGWGTGLLNIHTVVVILSAEQKKECVSEKYRLRMRT